MLRCLSSSKPSGAHQETAKLPFTSQCGRDVRAPRDSSKRLGAERKQDESCLQVCTSLSRRRIEPAGERCGSCQSFLIDNHGVPGGVAQRYPCRSALLGRDGIQIGLAENGGDPTQEGCFFEVDSAEVAFDELKSNRLENEDAGFRIDQHGKGVFKSCTILPLLIALANESELSPSRDRPGLRHTPMCA